MKTTTKLAVKVHLLSCCVRIKVNSNHYTRAFEVQWQDRKASARRRNRLQVSLICSFYLRCAMLVWILAVAGDLHLCLSVTSQHSVEMDGFIELVFGV